MRKLVAAVVALTAVSAGVGLLLQPWRRSPVASAEGGSERTSSTERALGTAVAALKADVARLERGAARGTRVEIPVARSEGQTAESGERPLRDKTSRPLESKVLAAAYQAHFTGEAVDASWRAQQE